MRRYANKRNILYFSMLLCLVSFWKVPIGYECRGCLECVPSTDTTSITFSRPPGIALTSMFPWPLTSSQERSRIIVIHIVNSQSCRLLNNVGVQIPSLIQCQSAIRSFLLTVALLCCPKLPATWPYSHGIPVASSRMSSTEFYLPESLVNIRMEIEHKQPCWFEWCFSYGSSMRSSQNLLKLWTMLEACRQTEMILRSHNTSSRIDIGLLQWATKAFGFHFNSRTSRSNIRLGKVWNWYRTTVFSFGGNAPFSISDID